MTHDVKPVIYTLGMNSNLIKPTAKQHELHFD